MSTTMKQITVKISAEIDKFNSAMKTLSSKLDTAKKDFQGLEKAGEALTSLGTKLTAGITVPIGAMAIAGTKASIDMESAFAGVRKTLDVSGKTAKETEKIYKDMENGIVEMSKKMPTAATEIAGVAEAAGQLGIKTENVLGFTEVMVKLGDTTNLSADEAATALARLANITGMPQTEFDRLGSTIVALGNNLATTEGEITEMALRLAGAGAQVGMTEANIVSFAGALSSVGINAEAGGSAFSKVMIDMQSSVEKGGERLSKFAEVAGMSASEFKKAFETDAAGAIVAFIQGLGNAEQQGKSAIGILDEMGIKEIVLRDALLRAAGASDVFTDAIEIGNSAWEKNTALTDEANQRYETTASKIEIAKNKLVAVGKEIGDRLVPVVQTFVDWVTKMCDGFLNLSPTVQNIILIFAGLLAVIPPIIALVGGLMTGFAAMQVASAVLGVSLGTVVGAFLLIPAAIAAVIAVIAIIIANWDSLKESAINLASKIGECWDNIVEWTKEKWSAMWDVISNWWSNLMSTIGQWFAPLGEIISNGWNTCVNATKQVWTTMSNVVSEAWKLISNLVQVGIMLVKEVISAGIQLILLPWTFIWENCKDVIIPIFESISKFLSQTLEKIKSFISEKLDAISKYFSDKWTDIKDTTTKIYESISNAISEKLQLIKDKVTEKLNNIANFFSEKWNSIKDKTTEIYNNISTSISEKLEQTKTNVSEKLNSIKTFFSEKFESAKQTVSEKMSAIRQSIQEKINAAKEVVSNALNSIKSKFDIVGTIYSNVKSKFDSIKSAITNAINGARDAVSSAINKIKSILNITLSFPKIKMPHFSITGKFSLNPPSVPKFSVRWYNKGGIFKHKTVLPNGMGVGDASFGGVGNNAEAILPINKLPELLGLDKRNNDGGLTLNISEFNNNRDYDIEKLANELAYYLKRKQVIGGV